MTTLVNRLRRRQKGFTLIELLVVVAIIALLATFAVPKLFDAINKSKKAPGQADMQTISGALERYYMDNNLYPTTDVENELATGYVKAATTYRNGFKNQYLYLTNTSGTAYVLVDIGNTQVAYGGNQTASFSLECGATDVTFTMTKDANVHELAVATATDAVMAGCVAPAADGGAIVRN